MAVQVARASKDICLSELGIEGKSRRALDYLVQEPLSEFIVNQIQERLMEVIYAGGEGMVSKLVKSYERRQEPDQQKPSKDMLNSLSTGSKTSLHNMRLGLLNHVEK